jgi:hypothetical protein
MMSADGAECEFLVLANDLIEKALVSKGAIIGVVVLDEAMGLSHHYFESLHGKDCFFGSEILH